MTRLAMLCLLVAACKRGDDAKTSEPGKPADPKAAAAPTATAKPTADGKCPADFTFQPTGLFCIKLPAGVSSPADGGPGRPSGNGSITQYGWSGGPSGSDFGITVMVSKLNDDHAYNVEHVVQPPYEGKLGAQGKLADGAWATGDDGPPPAGKPQRRWIHSATKSDKLQLTCSVTRASGSGSPTEQEVFDACMTNTFAKS